MNKLSWLLYAADVLGNFQTLFGVIAGIGLFGGALWGAAYANDLCERPPLVKLLLGAFVFAVIACLLPQTSTVYMIAGSEAGQTAVNSDMGRKVMTAVEKAIDSYSRKDGGK